MLSKEVGVVGLALVVVQDLWLEKDRRAWLARREVPLLYATYFLAAALYLLVRTSVIGGLGIPDTSPFDNPLVGVGTGTRLATAWVVVMQGLGLLAFPLRQSPDYSFDAIPVVAWMGDPRLWVSLGATGLLAIALLDRRVRASAAPLAAVWYGLALLPASNLLVVSGTIFAERLLYLPSAAFCVVAGAALAEAARRWPRAGWGAAGVVILLLAGQSWRYSSAWTDDVALFRHAARAVPASTKAHHKLGEELLRRGEHGDALRSLHRALAAAPTNGYAAETLATARRLVAERHYGPARSARAFPDDPAVLYALGAWALEASDTAVALEAVERAVALEPTLARGWLTLALIARDRGEEAVAERHLRRFLSTAGELYPQEQAWARSILPGVR